MRREVLSLNNSKIFINFYNICLVGVSESYFYNHFSISLKYKKKDKHMLSGWKFEYCYYYFIKIVIYIFFKFSILKD